jgi:queuine/archaeosine tRNA-ribosyltransferase
MEARKATTETPEVKAEPGVISTITNLDAAVTIALNKKQRQLLVSQDVLKQILGERYKNDTYMIYRNIELHDVNFAEQNMKKSKETIEQRTFGASKARIKDNRAPNGPIR